MTHEQIIAELVRIWHSPHLDLMLKAGLAEVIETLKEKNQSDSLVTDSSDDCKESESKLDLIRREDAIEAIESRQTEQWIESDIDYNSGLESALCEIKALPSAEPKTDGVLCVLADRECPFQGKEYAWCLTCPHISEEDRALVKAVASEPKTGWIPVSERLPENNGCMLVTIDDAIEFGKYEDGEWSIWVCEHWDEWDAKGVTAWMPLPKPYREDGEA